VTINNNPELFEFGNWNEYNLNLLTSINWRASLVPAAAVIPAPIAYIKVVAVKKLVVGFLDSGQRLLNRCTLARVLLLEDNFPRGVGVGTFTLKKLECSKQAFWLGYISME
jgi:hypothetical protein